MLKHISPLLQVSDLKVSVAFYGEKLGFETGSMEGRFSIVRRDDCSIFLAHTEGSDGALYGIAYGDRNEVSSRIFRHSNDGGTITLHRFDAQAGLDPVGTLVEGPDGAFYGVTQTSDFEGNGTIFRITKGGIFKTLATLNEQTGNEARGSLVFGPDGNLYGIAGPALYEKPDSVYRVTTAGTLSVLARFESGYVLYPRGELIVGPGGRLYGTSLHDGQYLCGTVFSVSLDGKIKVRGSFDGETNGALPDCALSVGPDGRLYGTTSNTIFRLEIPNSVPVANDDSLTLPIIRQNVLRNDTEPDHDVLRIVSVTDGAHGTAGFSADGTVTYTLDPSYVPDVNAEDFSFLIDSFTYTISDGFGGTSTATVRVSLPHNTRKKAAGNYGGTLNLNDAPQGYVEIRLTSDGAFTGVIIVDGVKTPIKGVFGVNGNFAKSVKRAASLSPLAINFQLDPIRNRMVGIVSDGSETYSMDLIRNLPIYPSSSPAPRAGRYTLLLTPAQADPALPGGTGFARMTVSKGGAVTIAGKLGDGQPFTTGSFLTGDEVVSLYASAYRGKRGYVAGSLAFSSLEESDTSGSLSWRKPAQPADPLYPTGFATNVNLVGARYMNGTPVMRMSAESPDGQLLFEGKNEKGIYVWDNNAVEVTSPAGDRTKIKINPKTGVFNGSYLDDFTRRAFGGVIFQKGVPHGEGVFLNENSSGKVSIVPFPP